MKTLYLILFSLTTVWSNGQNWKIIPGTKTEFSHFTNADNTNWFLVHYEYFRQGDSVIGVSRGLTEDFYSLFQESPNAFKAIFNSAFLKTTPAVDTLLKRFDSSILKIEFKQAIIIEDREIVYGYKEVIWRLKNYTWSQFQYEPCFVHLVFGQRNKPPKKGYLDHRFLVALDMGCEI